MTRLCFHLRREALVLPDARLDRPQILLEAPRRRPVDVVAMGVRLVLDAARGHVKGIRLHRVARELLVEVRIKIPRPRLEHEPRGPAFHQESSRLRERDDRYCNQTCQHDHWRRGHKQMCKKIHRGGNAEQYNADKKYKEAVAVAVEACAEDTKGQTWNFKALWYTKYKQPGECFQLCERPFGATMLRRSQVAVAQDDSRGTARSRRES